MSILLTVTLRQAGGESGVKRPERPFPVLPESWGLMLAERSELGIMKGTEFQCKLDLIHRPVTARPYNRVVYEILLGFLAVRLWCRKRETPRLSGAPKGQRDNSPGQGPPERSAGGPPPWVDATRPRPSLFPSFVFSRLEAWKKQNSGKERYSYWAPYPGRRSACPGLLSCRPCGTLLWLAPLE